MSARKLWPALALDGSTVAVSYADGSAFPAAGSVVPFDIYYSALYSQGKLVDYDPRFQRDAGDRAPTSALSSAGARAMTAGGLSGVGVV